MWIMRLGSDPLDYVQFRGALRIKHAKQEGGGRGEASVIRSVTLMKGWLKWFAIHVK